MKGWAFEGKKLCMPNSGDKSPISKFVAPLASVTFVLMKNLKKNHIQKKSIIIFMLKGSSNRNSRTNIVIMYNYGNMPYGILIVPTINGTPVSNCFGSFFAPVYK